MQFKTAQAVETQFQLRVNKQLKINKKIYSVLIHGNNPLAALAIAVFASFFLRLTVVDNR